MNEMNPAWRKIIRMLLTLLFGILSLPMLGLGLYYFSCWFRVHISNTYYVEYPYFIAALVWIGVGVFSLLVTLYGAWRRSFYGVLFVIPLFLALASGAIIPNLRPSMGRIDDINYLSDITSFFRVWSDENGRFPANDTEFKEAMVKGPAAWQYRVSPAPEGRYRQRGRALPYEVVIATNATGARTNNVSSRPGVVYYCVSSDLQDYWVTMTVLDKDVAEFAHLKKQMIQSWGEYEIFHAHRRGEHEGKKGHVTTNEE